MGILETLNNGKAPATNRAQRRAGNNGEKRETSKFWLNAGYETGEGRFVPLAYGIPLDNIEDLKTSGQNEEFVALRHAQNELKDDLLAEAAKLQPGQEVVIQLQVRLRRANEAMDIAPESNPFRRTSGLVAPQPEAGEAEANEG